MDPNSIAHTHVNEPADQDIPTRRRRMLVVLGLALTAGVAAAAVVALAAGGSGPAVGTVASTGTPLKGAPPLRIELPGRPPKGTEAQLRVAERELPAGDVRIAVA